MIELVSKPDVAAAWSLLRDIPPMLLKVDL